jgi:pilus assembly protein FimV
VRGGDTLSEIASGLHSGRSLDQTMLALLRANPDAFIGGNINLVRQGAVLRMPRAEELSRYSSGEAAAIVRAQVTEWREARQARRQPAPVAAATVDAAPGIARSPGATATSTPEARLEIVPPSSGSGKAGTRSGIQAGGEGRMLRQEIQETQETLAARDAELGDLKARVAELEKIQQQQQQLIKMKDSALASARANLAKANAAQPVVAKQPAQADGSLLWPWLLAALVVAVLAAWWFMRRRGAKPRPRLFDSVAMAASMPKAEPAPVPEAAPAPTPVPAPAAAVQPEPVPMAEPEPHWTAAPALVGTVPTWRNDPKAPAGFDREEVLTPARQVELARAYFDLGDNDAARELLREVVDGRDPVAREIAARMLRELE